MSVDIQKNTKAVTTYSVKWPDGTLTKYDNPMDAAIGHLHVWFKGRGLSYNSILGKDYDKIVHKVDELRMWLRKEEEEEEKES